MKTFKLLIIASILGLSMTNCKQSIKKDEVQQGAENIVISPSKHLGEYVSEGYDERDKGSDWVAVSVKESNGDNLSIVIHSRDDIKKPTCTFEAECQKKDDSTYLATVKNKNILFTFNDAKVKISTEKPEDSDYLSFFCSGGATLAGSYTRIINQ